MKNTRHFVWGFDVLNILPLWVVIGSSLTLFGFLLCTEANKTNWSNFRKSIFTSSMTANFWKRYWITSCFHGWQSPSWRTTINDSWMKYFFMKWTLREKSVYSEFFWSVFSRIWTRKTPNTDTFHTGALLHKCKPPHPWHDELQQLDRS